LEALLPPKAQLRCHLPKALLHRLMMDPIPMTDFFSILIDIRYLAVLKNLILNLILNLLHQLLKYLLPNRPFQVDFQAVARGTLRYREY
jgi:hypothetical protein